MFQMAENEKQRPSPNEQGKPNTDKLRDKIKPRTKDTNRRK